MACLVMFLRLFLVVGWTHSSGLVHHYLMLMCSSSSSSYRSSNSSSSTSSSFIAHSSIQRLRPGQLGSLVVVQAVEEVVVVAVLVCGVRHYRQSM